MNIFFPEFKIFRRFCTFSEMLKHIELSCLCRKREVSGKEKNFEADQEKSCILGQNIPVKVQKFEKS